MRKSNVCMSLEHSLSPLSLTSLLNMRVSSIFPTKHEKKNATNSADGLLSSLVDQRFTQFCNIPFVSFVNSCWPQWVAGILISFIWSTHSTGVSFLVFHLHRNSRRSFNLDYGRLYLWSSFTECMDCVRVWAQSNSKLITPQRLFLIDRKIE